MNIWTLSLILLLACGLPAEAGKLADFEAKASAKTRASSSSSLDSRKRSRSSRAGIGLQPAATLGTSGEQAAQGLGLAYLTGFVYAMERMDPASNLVEPREPGDSLLPLLRLDLDYQYLDSDVEAWHLHGEAGYGPVAFVARHARFHEDNGDRLRGTTLLGLLRGSYSRHFEMDMGIGAYQLAGDEEHWGFAFSLPILVYLNDHVGFEYRPMWTRVEGNHIREMDFGVVYGWQHAGLKLGYRDLDTDGAHLDGFYGGVSLTW